MNQCVRTKLYLCFMVLALCLLSPLSVLADDESNDQLLSDIQSIAAGPTSGYAIKKDGTAYAWGGGVPLGDGKNSPSSTPVKMNIDHVKQIAAGGRHTLILKTDGTVWAIGANDRGQLGNGRKSAAVQTKPVQVMGLKDIKAVAAGENHSLALTKNEHVFAWGGNEDGQIGNGSRKDVLKPFEVRDIVRVHRLAAGKNVSLTLGGGGETFIWGLKQVRKGRSNDFRKPTLLNFTLKGVSNEFFAIFAEDTRAAGLDALGRVCLWDNLTRGNPGDTLTMVDGLKDVASVTTDSAVKSDGTVWKWTKNSKGKFVATQVPGIKNAVSITKGKGTYYVLLKDGHVMTWGANDKGQAGLGVKDKVMKTPQPVISPVDRQTQINKMNDQQLEQLKPVVKLSFADYLQSQTKSSMPSDSRIKDFIVHDNIQILKNSQNVYFIVTFDTLAATSDFVLAGGGELSKDGWYKNRELHVVMEYKGGQYRISSVSSGP